MLIIRNGNVMPMAGENFTGDIAIEGKKIVAILPDVGDRYLSTGIFD